jgi:hypothetical protein
MKYNYSGQSGDRFAEVSKWQQPTPQEMSSTLS